ncbi:MAG TPA: hypothetical protein VHB98_11395, partial [Chloroflexota bacterium]|nr:hypothetical protein [Chloroflexota bacterium]
MFHRSWLARAVLALFMLWRGAGAPVDAAFSAPSQPVAVPLLVAASAVQSSGDLGQSVLWRMNLGTTPLRLLTAAAGSTLAALARSPDGQH